MKTANKHWAWLLWGISALCASAEPGGQGVLRPANALNDNCFKTASAVVPEICGKVEVRWKLSALMGEPVGNYGLVWSLTSVRLLADDGLGAKPRSYPVASLPPALARAARGSELTLEGLAHIKGAKNLTLHFDTGAPTRPDGKVSFNVAGSPDWDAFLIADTRRPQNWHSRCDAKHRIYAPAAEAKDIIRKGVVLERLEVCPGTRASIGNLETAIRKHCEQGGREAFCPREDPGKPDSAKPKSKAPPTRTDYLEEAQDRMNTARQHAQMTAAFRAEAQASCEREANAAQNKADACVRKACAMPPGLPSSASCTGIPQRPVRGLHLTAAGCDRACQQKAEERISRELKERQTAWDARWGERARQCQPLFEAEETAATCRATAAQRCATPGVEVQSCVQKRMANAPTQNDAATALRQQKQQRTKTPQRPVFLD
ncbi:hypothetical protein [Thauera linaloolentis]|uniref:Uncharacterized protein n=1 Tax=Thauera linaloolentis (strain DSM 12138 / JCM 21573 / CCUG 41526 / CIP 105981 / IAM 15112 / NBRC 102519 / 47Lol) TaxID=1123367 RepID=N6Z515_THAL4|nr:hypothetical protein [Thauera linaloolentis]ENO89513.1 hypothetical protein C666_05655 [Thauera linaloolentis 47Lol = DSM 12138]MCM8565408.1 hypothetical protein [Thauera linaloolentis]